MGGVKAMPCSLRRRQAPEADGTLLVGHNHVAIHKITEMGSLKI